MSLLLYRIRRLVTTNLVQLIITIIGTLFYFYGLLYLAKLVVHSSIGSTLDSGLRGPWITPRGGTIYGCGQNVC